MKPLAGKEIILDQLRQAQKTYHSMIDKDTVFQIVVQYLMDQDIITNEHQVEIIKDEDYSRPWVGFKELPEQFDNVNQIGEKLYMDIVNGDGPYLDALLSAAIDISLVLEWYMNDGRELDAYLSEAEYSRIKEEKCDSIDTKHYLIYGKYYQTNPIGCARDPANVLYSGSEPEATLVQVNPEKCPICKEVCFGISLSEILKKNIYIDGDFEVVTRDFDAVPFKRQVVKADKTGVN